MEDYNRLKKLIDQLGLTDGKFAIEIGVTPQSIGNVRIGRNGLGDKIKRAILAKYPNVNESWLDKGVGEMFVENFNNRSENKLNSIESFLESRIRKLEAEIYERESLIRDLYRTIGKLENEIEVLRNEDISRKAAEPNKRYKK